MQCQASEGVSKASTIRRRSLARTLTCDADLPDPLVEALWRGDVERLVFSAVPLQVKDRCIAARLDHATGTFILKRHTWGSLGRTLRSAWRSSVARGSLRLGRRLADLGVPTPRPRAVLEQRFGLVGYRSYLLTDYVEGTSLYDYVRLHDPSAAEIEPLAQQVVAIWQQLVALGISHNDMKPENFIVDPARRVWLIDLERVRFHRHRGRMRRRQLGDVRTFLDPRAWRNRREARDVFQAAFLESAHGDWLRHAVTSPGQSAANIGDERLSVLIVCEDSSNLERRLQKTVESVRNLADEIVLVSPDQDQTTSRRLGNVPDVRLEEPATSRQAQHPWVLVLYANEQVTPLLAIDVEEAIADAAAADAYRIGIDQFMLGCRVPDASREAAQVRLFNQWQCSYSVVGGALAISTDPERTGQLDGAVQREAYSDVAEYLDALNTASTRAARERFQQGERAKLARTTLGSLRRFIAMYALRGGYQHGWAGFRLSVLQAFESWLEEVKLWQLAHEFAPSSSDIAQAEGGDVLSKSALRRPA